LQRERGFTLIEILIAAAICLAIAVTSIGVIASLLRAARQSPSNAAGTMSFEQQIDALRSDAATSFAVFVPERDVHGNLNGGSGHFGHEVDFYSKTDTGMPIFWAYDWDAQAKTLQRYDFDVVGHVGEADRQTGAIAQADHYPPTSGITSFSAQTLEATDLVGPKNAYGSVIAPLLTGTVPRALPVGYDVGPVTRTDLYGGNTTVQIELSTSHETRTVHLATGALPSGFTIREEPEIRAIVYRHDTTDRSWLGLVQKSHVFIQARLLVSYSHFSEAHPIVWCDYNIYGYPGGLEAPFQADADYQPTWFEETTAGIVYHVIHGKTNGSTCSTSPPSAGAANESSQFFTPPPDTQETPPPCFVGGACRPANASADSLP
jgi:prepilin-type N-terminal cleavage/methylation domain-containing protein